MKKMDKDDCSKLHVAMFPWFAFSHCIPYLYLSNKLAAKGHRVSFLSPKGMQPKLEKINQYLDLIQFFPLVLSHVDGLPPGAESTSNVSNWEQLKYLTIAMDQTRDQVEAILQVQKPDMVFYDFGCWIPALARQIGIKSIYYAVYSTMSQALLGKKVSKEMSVEELMETPPGFPSSKVRFKAEEVPILLGRTNDFGMGLSLQDRLRTSAQDGDAIAFRTCREFDGPFCDYVAQLFGKSVLLSGPCLPEPETPTEQHEEKWVNWLSLFKPSSVVFCSMGSMDTLEKEEFQELLLGLELSGLPFLLALRPPKGCLTIEEAFPEGFEDRIQGRGLVHGGWVPQEPFLRHPSIGCFVNHCGYGSMWEFLMTSECQLVLIPGNNDQILSTRFLVEELKVAVEVDRGKTRKISKESLSKAIKLVMDKDNEMARMLKSNHSQLKQQLSNKDLQEEYVNNFIQGLRDRIIKKKVLKIN